MKYLPRASLKPHWLQIHKLLDCPYNDLGVATVGVTAHQLSGERTGDHESSPDFSLGGFEGEGGFEDEMGIEGGLYEDGVSEGNTFSTPRMETYPGAGSGLLLRLTNEQDSLWVTPTRTHYVPIATGRMTTKINGNVLIGSYIPNDRATKKYHPELAATRHHG